MSRPQSVWFTRGLFALVQIFKFSNNLRTDADGDNRAGSWREDYDCYDERVHR
jgi:hypothetical protein